MPHHKAFGTAWAWPRGSAPVFRAIDEPRPFRIVRSSAAMRSPPSCDPRRHSVRAYASEGPAMTPVAEEPDPLSGRLVGRARRYPPGGNMHPSPLQLPFERVWSDRPGRADAIRLSERGFPRWNLSFELKLRRPALQPGKRIEHVRRWCPETVQWAPEVGGGL